MKNLLHVVLKVSLKNRHAIKVATQPLLDHFGIHYFYYFQVTNEGHYAFFSNQTEWNAFGFKENLYQQSYYSWQPWNFPLGLKLHFRKEEPCFDSLSASAKTYGISYLFVLTNRNASSLETYGFGSSSTKSPDPEMIPLLKLFVSQFPLNHSALFNQLKESKIDLVKEIGPKFYKRQTLIQSCNHHCFLQEIGLAPSSSLSNREKSICVLLAQGCTARAIAERMELSTRTVETYLEKLKCKFNCFSKESLMARCIELNSVAYFNH
jgi:DNA-binding CsgD family transcriptional regulator